MPNYTWNTINARPEVINQLLTAEGKFTFDKFIHVPDELWNTTAGGRVHELIALHILDTYTKEKALELFEKLHLSFWIFSKKPAKSMTKKAMREMLLERLNGETEDLIRDYTKVNYPVIRRITGAEYFNLHMKYGCHDWYDFCCRYWGTKWDAFDVYIGDGVLEFTTAWSAPEPILRMICEMFPNEEIDFVMEYEDNLLVEAENVNGSFVETNSYEKCIPEDDYDYDDLPWINSLTGEERD